MCRHNTCKWFQVYYVANRQVYSARTYNIITLLTHATQRSMEYTAEQIDIAIKYAVAKLGFDSVKEKQHEAVKTFVSGKDTFVSLPTGYGKSLCYCLLPLVYDYLRRKKNISPLTALMLDQRSKYAPRGLATEMVGETQQDQGALQDIQDGKYQLVYISPEALLGGTCWREMLHSPSYQRNLVAFVVDEAHCITKWQVF